jgi:hypothetical protein
MKKITFAFLVFLSYLTLGFAEAKFNDAVIDPNLSFKSQVLNSNGVISEIEEGNGIKGLSDSVSAAPCTGAPITWDGTTWSNGVGPDNTTPAILDGDYNTAINGGSFVSCSLTISPGWTLTINNGEYIEVEADVVVETGGEILVETQGALIQRGDGSAAGSFVLNGTASAQVNKFTAPLANWYNYTYWSSPVANADIDIALFSADADRRFLFNANNFLDLDGNDVDDDGNDWVLATGTGTMTPGRGYAATHSEIGFVAGTQYQYNFMGAFNTGDYTFPLAFNIVNANHYNLAGNPYPSAIDVDLLFGSNSSIQNLVYIWSQFRLPSDINLGNEVLNFSQSDYLTINAVTQIGNGSDLNGDGVVDGLDIPERKIPSAQGFFVISTSANPLLFTNSMRVVGDNENDAFYRNFSSSISEDILWLNLNSDNGAYSQTAIGYVNGATSGFDGPGYDSKRQGSNNTAAILYTQIANDEQKFAIQGKAAEDISSEEVIALGFLTNLQEATVYTIKALKFEGDFLSNNPIYLKDNLLNITHNLKESEYNFTSEAGEFNDRFEIVFQESALNINTIEIGSSDLSIVELNDGRVEFTIAKNVTIENVVILGRCG